MKTNNWYFNTILTVLTICMIGIVIQNQMLIRELKKEKSSNDAKLNSYQVSNPTARYTIVPVNEDGSIDVKIKAISEVMDVNITKVDGYPISNGQLPVKTSMTEVNIKQIDGERVFGSGLPVKADLINVNVKEVNGYRISGGSLPITGK